MTNERMNMKAHWWFLIAIIILALGTTIALTRQQANFDQHQDLDQHACTLAHQNREIMSKIVDTLANDPGGHNAASVAEFQALDKKLDQLLVDTEKVNCSLD
jgi:hypothetical protein